MAVQILIFFAMCQLNESYSRLNGSFRRRLVYHVGVDAGFFAEYTHMLHGMLYCLQHGLRFELYSDDANFGFSRGWQDYFKPFCTEVHEPFHHKYNVYALPSWPEIARRAWSAKSLRLPEWKLKASWLHAMGRALSRMAYGERVLLSHDVRLDLDSRFHIPALGVDGGYLEAFRAVSAVAWRLNGEVEAKCRSLAASLHLPERYVGCQVRGGDKVTETSLLPPAHYVRMIRRCGGQDVFVLTDDYRLFEQLEQEAPDIRWHTLCSPQEQGYVNSSFSRSGALHKRERMIRFLASMEILMRSSLFIGSVTTGPSLFLLKLGYPSVLPADCRPEDFPAICRMPVGGRSRAAAEYLASEAGKP